MRILIVCFLATLSIPQIADAKNVEMPPNVTVRQLDKHNTVIDKVDFSYTATSPVKFAQLKLCVAENVTPSKPGNDLFKFSDEGISALIATGAIDDVLFDLKAAVAGSSVTLTYTNVARLSSTYGVLPLGIWRGARPMQAYTALESSAAKIKSCIG
jgi:hypothetical protein